LHTTEHTAITRFGAQHDITIRTAIEELAAISRHGFFSGKAALWTGYGGLQLHSIFSHLNSSIAS
jgi:hypothetical protein